MEIQGTDAGRSQLLWLHTPITRFILTLSYGFDYVTLYHRNLSVMLSLFS